jgi:hypothetical protein
MIDALTEAQADALMEKLASKANRNAARSGERWIKVPL